MADKPATQKSLNPLKKDVGIIKSDVGVLKSDVDALKKDVGLLKTQLGAVEDRLDRKIDRVAVATVKLQADVSEIQETIATKLMTKDDFRRFFAVVENYSSKYLNLERESITFPVLLDEHGKTLKDHSKRISALENPR